MIVNAFCNFYQQLAHPDQLLLTTYVSDAAAACLERALAPSATLPMLTPFSHVINPRLLCESYLSVTDDMVGGFGFGPGGASSAFAQHIADLEGSTDNAAAMRLPKWRSTAG